MLDAHRRPAPLALLALLLIACGGAAPAPQPATPSVEGLLPPPAPSKLASGFETWAMLDIYTGEEHGGGYYKKKITYLKAAERARHVLHVRQGKLTDATGKVLDAQLGEDGTDERGGFCIYAMAPDGTIYVSFDHKQGTFHHSSLVAGQPVAGAGDMTVIDGEVLELSNSSGHYRPPPRSLKQVQARLEEMGLKLDGVKITALGKDE